MNTVRKPRGRPRDDERTARRAEEILDVAAGVFAQRGYRNTDVQVVADQLGVGKGTIYRYFHTKRQLFLAAADRGMQRLVAEINTVPAELDPLDQIAQAVRAYLNFYDAHPEYVELLIQERAEFKDRSKPTYFEYRGTSVRWGNVMRELVAQGRVRASPREELSEVVGNLLYGTMFTNYFAGRAKPLEEQAREILDVVFFGILTPAEQARRAGSSG